VAARRTENEQWYVVKWINMSKEYLLAAEMLSRRNLLKYVYSL